MGLIVRLVHSVAVALAIGLTLASPAASDPPPVDQPGPPELADTAWRFVEILGAAPPSAVEPTLALFADGRAAGRAGCNLFSGRYAVDGGLTFSDLGYTKMACAPEVMATETAVQTALNRTTNGIVTPVGELHLVGSDGFLLARLLSTAFPAEVSTGE